MKVKKEEKLELWTKARFTENPLDIVNEFFAHPEGIKADIKDEYWRQKVAILADRIVEAEKSYRTLKKLTKLPLLPL